MPIYKVSDNRIIPIERTTFEQQGLRERQNLQNMLKAQIDIITADYCGHSE